MAESPSVHAARHLTLSSTLRLRLHLHDRGSAKVQMPGSDLQLGMRRRIFAVHVDETWANHASWDQL